MNMCPSKPDFSRCLRPTFTEGVFKALRKGQSLLILTADAADAQRLGEDIQALWTANEVCWVQVNLKSYAGSFAGLLQAIWQQLPDEVRGEAVPADWAALVALLERVPQPVLLWFDGLHRLFDNEHLDNLYDQRFLNSLNALRNNAHFSVVGVAEKPLVEYVWFIAGIPEKASLLELTQWPLVELSGLEIEQELLRHGVRGNDKVTVREAVRAMATHRYGFLAFVLLRLSSGEYDNLSLAERLSHWQADFQQGIAKPLPHSLRWFNLRNSLRWRQRLKLLIHDVGRWVNVFKLLSPAWRFLSRFIPDGWSWKKKP